MKVSLFVTDLRLNYTTYHPEILFTCCQDYRAQNKVPSVLEEKRILDYKDKPSRRPKELISRSYNLKCIGA